VWSNRYFPRRFFPDAYWGTESTGPLPTVDGAYYPEDYFSPRYWPRRYFPSEAGVVSLPTIPYSLTFVQTRMFQSLCDLWEPVRSIGTDGDVSAPTYTQRWADVPCYMQYLASDSEPSIGGRIEEDNQFTKSKWWFNQFQEVGDGWIAVLRTFDTDGTPHPDYGRGWIMGGDTEIWVNQIGGEGLILIVGTAQPVLPSGVS